MIITGRLHGAAQELISTNLIEKEKVKPSNEAVQVLDSVKRRNLKGEMLPMKLKLLDQQNRGYVVDSLLEAYDQNENMTALIAILSFPERDAELSFVIMEQLLRKITLSSNSYLKAKFMKMAPVDLVKSMDEGLRRIFFTEIIAIMNQDQFDDVNKITPAAPNLQGALPDELKSDYLRALLCQADSCARQGAPAARQAISNLPDEVAEPALAEFKFEEFMKDEAKKALRSLLERTRNIWPADKHDLFDAFISQPWSVFYSNYIDSE
jgi:hypothetical protein